MTFFFLLLTIIVSKIVDRNTVDIVTGVADNSGVGGGGRVVYTSRLLVNP